MKLLLQEIRRNPLLWLLVFVPIALAALAFLAQACCSSPVLTFMLRASRWTTREPNRRLQITVLPVVRRRMAGCVSSYAHNALSNQPAGDDFR
jgi:hypothetical protein